MKELNQPRITGSRVEQQSKMLLTSLFAAAFTVLFTLTHKAKTSPIFLAVGIAAGVELLILAILHKRLPLFLHSIPSFHLSACCIAYAVIHLRTPVSFRETLREAAIPLLFAVLLLLIAAGTIRAAKGNTEQERFDRRFCYKLPLCVAVLLGTPTILILAISIQGTVFTAMPEILALLSYVLAVYLVSLPDCILFNIKRIGRLCLMFVVLVLLFSGVIKATSLLFAAPISIHTLMLLAVMMTISILMIGAVIRCVIGVFRNDTASGILAWRQKPLTDRQQELLVEAGLSRDFVDEYACRYWNVSMEAEEVAEIQAQIRRLSAERADLQDANARAQLDLAVKGLLARLEEYRFHTGYDLYEPDDVAE